VCDWLDWRAANGKPKEVSSRKALLELERAGLIGLPQAQRPPPQGRCAAAVVPCAYSTQSGQPFHRKLDTRSRANWTVGAQRRAGVMVFTLGWVPRSMWV